MNKLGVHAFVWEHGWSKEQATRAINRTAEAGYDFIEAPSLDPSSIDPAVTTQAARSGRHRHRLLDGPRLRRRHLLRRPGQGEARQGAAARRRLGLPRLRRQVDRRHPLLRLRQVPHPADRRRRRPSGDILREVAEVAARSDIDPLPRGGEPLRDQHPQHRRPGRRDVPPHRRAERQGRTSTSTT